MNSIAFVGNDSERLLFFGTQSIFKKINERQCRCLEISTHNRLGSVPNLLRLDRRPRFSPRVRRLRLRRFGEWCVLKGRTTIHLGFSEVPWSWMKCPCNPCIMWATSDFTYIYCIYIYISISPLFSIKYIYIYVKSIINIYIYTHAFDRVILTNIHHLSSPRVYNFVLVIDRLFSPNPKLWRKDISIPS